MPGRDLQLADVLERIDGRQVSGVVDPADAPGLQRELAFEPASALFAPDRGLALSAELLAVARARQAPACLLEIGAGQGGELCRRALGAGWGKAMVHQDMAGHDRVLVVLA